MGYNEATNLLASLRSVKNHISYFNTMKINLYQFEEALDTIIADMVLYRKYIKLDFKQRNGL